MFFLFLDEKDREQIKTLTMTPDGLDAFRLLLTKEMLCEKIVEFAHSKQVFTEQCVINHLSKLGADLSSIKAA